MQRDRLLSQQSFILSSELCSTCALLFSSPGMQLQSAGVHVTPAGLSFAGRPEDSGISLQIVQELGPRIPVFGVCMGHQCIGQIFGGRIIRAPKGVMHGKTSLVYHNNTSLLRVSVSTCISCACKIFFMSEPQMLSCRSLGHGTRYLGVFGCMIIGKVP